MDEESKETTQEQGDTKGSETSIPTSTPEVMEQKTKIAIITLTPEGPGYRVDFYIPDDVKLFILGITKIARMLTGGQ